MNVENDWSGNVKIPQVEDPIFEGEEEELQSALRHMKNGKAVGPSGVVTQMTKAVAIRMKKAVGEAFLKPLLFSVRFCLGINHQLIGF